MVWLFQYMWKSRWNIKCSEARIHNHTQNLNTELKMMFRDTGSHLFHKFNMLLSITHDGDGQGHWQMLKEHSVMQLWTELTGYTWRISHRRCPQLCCRGPSLFVEAKSKQCRQLPCSNVNYGGLKENTLPAFDNQGNTPILLISDSGRKAVHQGFGKPSKN